jgi:hypothetical protein
MDVKLLVQVLKQLQMILMICWNGFETHQFSNSGNLAQLIVLPEFGSALLTKWLSSQLI